MNWDNLMDWFDEFYKIVTRPTTNILGVTISHAIIEIHWRKGITIVLEPRFSPSDLLDGRADRRIAIDLPLQRVEKLVAGEDTIFPYEFAWEEELTE